MDLESQIINMVMNVENKKTLAKIYAIVKKITERERQRPFHGKRVSVGDAEYETV